MTDAFHHYHRALGLGEPMGYLALSGRAALLDGRLFCSLLFFSYEYYKKKILYLGYLFCLLLVVCGNAESNPGPGSD